MDGPDRKKGNWKKRIFHEMVEYWINVVYLALVFAAFTQYRRSFWLPMTSLTRITG